MRSTFLETFKQHELRKCQLKELYILEKIDNICRKHNIEYWLDGGTLLGAVRHGGFIPWDDDIDIAMRKEDMERFIAVATNELGDNLTLQLPTKSEPVTKIRDLNSFFIEPTDDLQAERYRGIFVDIFPFIDYPTISRRFAKYLTFGIWKSFFILHRKHYYSFRAVAEFIWFGLKYIIFRILWAIICLFYPKNKYISNVLTNNCYGIMHRKESIFPIKTIEFEGKTFSAPANPDDYLTDLYGNYMEIPAPEKQKSHSLFILSELNPKHP